MKNTNFQLTSVITIVKVLFYTLRVIKFHFQDQDKDRNISVPKPCLL